MTSELDVKLAALDYRRCRVRVNGQLFELDRDNPAHLAPDLTSDPPGAERDLQPTPKSSNQYLDQLVEQLGEGARLANADEREKGYYRLCRDAAKAITELRSAHETSPDPKGLAVVRAAQLDLAAKTLDRHDCHVQGEACREAAQLLREFAGVRAENGPREPLNAEGWMCACGVFNYFYNAPCGHCERPAPTRRSEP